MPHEKPAQRVCPMGSDPLLAVVYASAGQASGDKRHLLWSPQSGPPPLAKTPSSLHGHHSSAGQSGHQCQRGRAQEAPGKQPAHRGTVLSHQSFPVLLAPPTDKDGGNLEKGDPNIYNSQRPCWACLISVFLRPQGIHQLSSCQQNLRNM